jgi:DNA end-binding protein Ku
MLELVRHIVNQKAGHFERDETALIDLTNQKRATPSSRSIRGARTSSIFGGFAAQRRWRGDRGQDPSESAPTKSRKTATVKKKS